MKKWGKFGLITKNLLIAHILRRIFGTKNEIYIKKIMFKFATPQNKVKKYNIIKVFVLFVIFIILLYI